MPASIASSMKSAGNVFDTATSVTSSRERPARAQALAMRASTAARFSRIDTMPFDPSVIRSALGPVERGVGQAVGVLVPGAQRVANVELWEMPRHRFRAFVQRHEVRM